MRVCVGGTRQIPSNVILRFGIYIFYLNYVDNKKNIELREPYARCHCANCECRRRSLDGATVRCRIFDTRLDIRANALMRLGKRRRHVTSHVIIDHFIFVRAKSKILNTIIWHGIFEGGCHSWRCDASERWVRVQYCVHFWILIVCQCRHLRWCYDDVRRTFTTYTPRPWIRRTTMPNATNGNVKIMISVKAQRRRRRRSSRMPKINSDFVLVYTGRGQSRFQLPRNIFKGPNCLWEFRYKLFKRYDDGIRWFEARLVYESLPFLPTQSDENDGIHPHFAVNVLSIPRACRTLPQNQS